MKNIHPSILLGVLFLFGAAGLLGCSKAPEEQKADKLKEGYGKTIDPYEKKDNGKLGATQRTQVHDPYAKPPSK
jgi:hypothetical protein